MMIPCVNCGHELVPVLMLEENQDIQDGPCACNYCQGITCQMVDEDSAFFAPSLQ
jgi:hypothetical protein